MNSHRVHLSWALAAVCLASIGLTSTARAAFVIRLDCHGTNNQPSFSPTNDRVTVAAKINGSWLELGAVDTTARFCDQDLEVVKSSSAFSGHDVQAIRVAHTGKDVFWIDRVYLYDVDTKKVWNWGVDNNFGWCLAKYTGGETNGQTPFCSPAGLFSAWDFRK
jgi:hypothetical protein